MLYGGVLCCSVCETVWLIKVIAIQVAGAGVMVPLFTGSLTFDYQFLFLVSLITSSGLKFLVFLGGLIGYGVSILMIMIFMILVAGLTYVCKYCGA